jgi:Bacterial Ig domain/Right handed beta helix region/Bacterial Ig-like domain
MVRFACAVAAVATVLVVIASTGAHGAACTTTVSSTSAAVSAVNAAQPGSTVCLSDGSYGALTLNTSKAAPGVIVQAANPGKASLNGVDLSGAGITISQFMITPGSSAQGSGVVMRPGASRMVVDHNDFNIAGDDFGVFLYGDNGAISDVVIRGNRFHGSQVGDAIRLHNFRNVQVLDNEFQDVNEDGNHNDVLQTVHGGSNVVFKGNYVHDNHDGQGFFVKDGQVNGVQVLDNLFVREPGRGREISVQEASNVLIDHNTGWQVDQTLALTGPISGSCAITNNVWSRALENPCNQSGNVIGGSPAFYDSGHDDYRMQAGGAGVDWRPQDKVFGPGGGGSAPPPPPNDGTAPETNITSGPTSTTTSTSASFTFTSSESGSTFECKLDGAAFAACTSGKSYSGLAAGGHTFSVRATDPAGNTDTTPASQTWTITGPSDTTPPETTITAGPSGPTNDTTPTFAFSASQDGSTFACRVDTGAYAACASPWTTPALSAGDHSISVRATDSAGNTETTPATQSFTIDTTAPTTTITSAPPAQTDSGDASVAFTVNETGATSDCRLDGGAWSPCTSPFGATGLKAGTHTVGVRSVDVAGNVESPGASASWTVGDGGGSGPPPPADAPPTTELTAPTVGGTVSGWFRITADAGDDHGVDRVELWLGGTRLDRDDQAPYTTRVDASRMRSGTYTVSSRAFDVSGQSASAALTVRVARSSRGSRQSSSSDWAQLSSSASDGVTHLTGQTVRAGSVRVNLTACTSSRGVVVDSFTLRADQNGHLDATYASANRCVLRLDPM